MKRKDYTGNRYGKLTVTKMLYGYKNGKTYCKCQCDCGNEVIRQPCNLKRSPDASCGCNKKHVVQKYCGLEIDGKTFGRLTVLETLWEETPPRVKCICSCGNIGIYRKTDVQEGHTLSCGCLQQERAGQSNSVDYSGKISDYGVKIISRSRIDNYGRWVWKCQCGICNNYFEEIPIRILNNHVRSCGCKIQSSNESLIQNLLDSQGVSYKTQYTFNDCLSDNNIKLRFDFAIFKNNNLHCLIEYDGEQHYTPIEYFGGKQSFENTKRRDEIKNEYCKIKNIQLIRIPYFKTPEEIKEILYNILNP